MKVRHRASGQESMITDEEWAKIQENGFEIDFEALDSKPPEEVERALKVKGAKSGADTSETSAEQ